MLAVHIFEKDLISKIHEKSNEIICFKYSQLHYKQTQDLNRHLKNVSYKWPINKEKNVPRHYSLLSADEDVEQIGHLHRQQELNCYNHFGKLDVSIEVKHIYSLIPKSLFKNIFKKVLMSMKRYVQECSWKFY